jgi:hypothetical protein
MTDRIDGPSRPFDSCAKPASTSFRPHPRCNAIKPAGPFSDRIVSYRDLNLITRLDQPKAATFPTKSKQISKMHLLDRRREAARSNNAKPINGIDFMK